jgi:Xaa-Pro aminopeptidase
VAHAFRFILILAAAVFLLPPGAGRLDAQVPVREYEERRAELSRLLGDGIVLALGAPEPPQDYIPFFQGSNFHYLTGFEEPGGALVMVTRGGQRTTTLFVRPGNPAEEVWSGWRLGVEGAEPVLGVPGRDVGELDHVVDSLLAATDLPLQVVAEQAPAPAGAEILSHDAQRLRALVAERPQTRIVDARRELASLREVKSEAELELVRRAIRITVDAHREAMRAMAPGLNEFEIQALIEYTFRRNGADRPAFASIVGSGPNSTILHYNANDRFIDAGDMVVIDIGASYGGYAADITRTLPADGVFSDAQRDIYQLVRDAQAAAEAAARPGSPRTDMTRASDAVLREGLTRLGLIQAPDATYDCGSPEQPRRCDQLRLFYMHGLGHGIGLDVHDPWPAMLVPGSAFTIEPGVYVRPNLLEILPDTPDNRAMIAAIRGAFDRYRGIGVRIEDDYLVTDAGVEWVSRVPREIAEVEALMAEPFTAPAPRDEEKVEWYRGLRPGTGH